MCPSFNFKPCFAPKVESFEKLNTIRRNKKCEVGAHLVFYTGQRSKECRKIGEGTCTQVFKVKIHRDTLTIYHDENGKVATVYGTKDALDHFAQRDGFKDWTAMTEWFDHQYGLPFTGWFHAWKPRVDGIGKV